jgi:flavin reductase (DIM6/NTAB) family NADH-FMN oxidoreductase RutF
MKKTLKPGTMLYPLPAVLVTGGTMEESTVMTAAWTGIVCSEPPMTYVSIRTERYSHDVIRDAGEFVINLTKASQAFETDYAGCVSTRKEDKFERLGLRKLPGDVVKAPLIEQCPVNLECKVVEVKELGSHDMFLAQIVAVHVDEDLFNKEGRVCLEKAGLLAYIHGGYLPLGSRKIGTFGYSVMKPKTKKKKAAASRAASKTKAALKARAGSKQGKSQKKSVFTGKRVLVSDKK